MPGRYHVLNLAAEVVDAPDEDDTLDEDAREPTQVTRLLADFAATVDRSRVTMDSADRVSAKAHRLVRRKRNTPAQLMRAVRASIAPEQVEPGGKR